MPALVFSRRPFALAAGDHPRDGVPIYRKKRQQFRVLDAEIPTRCIVSGRPDGASSTSFRNNCLHLLILFSSIFSVFVVQSTLWLVVLDRLPATRLDRVKLDPFASIRLKLKERGFL